MPESKFDSIYQVLRERIENGIYPGGELLPSEAKLTDEFGCSRNTVRRALSILQDQGYVIARHGKGVQVIYNSYRDRNLFMVGGIESFTEAAERNHRKITTKAVVFEKIIADSKVSEKTGFDIGTELYHIERIRHFDGVPEIRDINYFLCSETGELTREIAEKSIYDHLENECGMNITTSKRWIMAESARKSDTRLLDLEQYDYVLVINGQVFNSAGIMFEFTQSRHRPDHFCFYETAVRKRI